MTRATSAPTPLAEPALACGNCREPMQRLVVDGHYGKQVGVDLCRHCDLVWFDDTESARIAGSGLLAIIGGMAEAYALPHEMLRPQCACPRCAGPLQTVNNQSRWGKSLQLQCLRRDGAYQSFAQFLQEKGLLRPMSAEDRARLIRDKGQVDCVNCGAAIGTVNALCPYCRSVPSLLDVARLARALDPLDNLEAKPPVFATPARQSAMACAACGSALPPGQTISCPQCHATLAIDSLGAAYDAVKALAEALRHAEEHPSPAVVKRRLQTLDADRARRLEFIDGLTPAEDSKFDADGGWKFRRGSGGFNTDTWGLRLLLGVAFIVWLLLQFATGIKH